jgi:hypothetical protein
MNFKPAVEYLKTLIKPLLKSTRSAYLTIKKPIMVFWWGLLGSVRQHFLREGAKLGFSVLINNDEQFTLAKIYETDTGGILVMVDYNHGGFEFVISKLFYTGNDLAKIIMGSSSAKEVLERISCPFIESGDDQSIISRVFINATSRYLFRSQKASHDYKTETGVAHRNRIRKMLSYLDSRAYDDAVRASNPNPFALIYESLAN